MKSLSFLISFLIFPFSIQAQTNYSVKKIVASDREADDIFGWSSAIEGNYAVVGAQAKNALFNNTKVWQAGAVYVFQKTNGSWKQIQKLCLNDSANFNWFGCSVAISGDYIVVGASGEDEIGSIKHPDIGKGAVFIFKKKNNGKFILLQKLVLSKRGDYDRFGDMVSISKDFIVANSNIKTLNSDNKTELIGAVHVFRKNPKGLWEIMQEIKPTTNGATLFGHSLDIKNNQLIIGQMIPEDVFVYELNKAGKWELTANLKRTDPKDAEFGSDVSINNNVAIVGAQGKILVNINEPTKEVILSRKLSKTSAGAVYVYLKNQEGKWDFSQRLVASDEAADQYFGKAIDVSDSLLVVGAFGDRLESDTVTHNEYAGAAYIFKKDLYGKWEQKEKLTANPRSKWDKYAFSVSCTNNSAIVGSRFEAEDENEKNSKQSAGAAYIYEELKPKVLTTKLKRPNH